MTGLNVTHQLDFHAFRTKLREQYEREPDTGVACQLLVDISDHYVKEPHVMTGATRSLAP